MTARTPTLSESRPVQMMNMPNNPSFITQSDLVKAIQEAKARGEDRVEIRHPTGGSIVITGPFHSPPRGFGREQAAAYCRCSDSQFGLLIKEGLLPNKLPRTNVWDRKALDAALRRIDVRPDGPVMEEVYFIEMKEFVKIGFSSFALSRMSSLQVSTPYELKMLFSMPGGPECEQRIHELFAPIRHCGEWFRKSKGLLAYIEWLRARKT